MKFALHPQLLHDLDPMTATEDFEYLFLPNGELPWVVIVPKVPGITEVFELSEVQQADLYAQIARVSKMIKLEFQCDKINIAAFGNMVPQLHIHIIGRYKKDSAWPGSVFGVKLKADIKNDSSLKEKITSQLLRRLE